MSVRRPVLLTLLRFNVHDTKLSKHISASLSRVKNSLNKSYRQVCNNLHVLCLVHNLHNIRLFVENDNNMQLCERHRKRSHITGCPANCMQTRLVTHQTRYPTGRLCISCKRLTMFQLRSSVADLSSRRPGFAPGSIHVGFVVDKVALGQVLLRDLRFSPVNIIPPSLSKLISSGECVIC
jgi:hypothetical protein